MKSYKKSSHLILPHFIHNFSFKKFFSLYFLESFFFIYLFFPFTVSHILSPYLFNYLPRVMSRLFTYINIDLSIYL